MSTVPPASGEWILHVDLDQFLAAVEVLRRPELAGRPVIVGGDGDPTRARQVVATASYEARAFGVRSGMPLRTAARKCPDAVFLPTDRAAYDAASAEVMATLRSFPVVVEVWGWDEAFVGATTDDPEALARAIKEAVRDRTRLSCAVGIGETRLQAKTATGFAKPGGVARLTRRHVAADDGRPAGHRHLGHRRADGADAWPRPGSAPCATWPGPTTRTWPAGSARAIGPSLRVLGPRRRRRAGRGRAVGARSRSKETTFRRDLTDPDQIDAQVDRLAAEVTESVVAEGRRVTHVHVKVRTATFFTRIKSASCPSRRPTRRWWPSGPWSCSTGSSPPAASACSACGSMLELPG